MPMFFKKRVIGLLAGLIFLALGGVIGYLGVVNVHNLLSYPDVLLFSRLSVLAAMSPLVFFPMLPLSGYLVCTGKQAPHSVQKKHGFIIVISAIVILFSMITFSNWYTSNLEKEGYVRCSGVPIGYMPFMAVKFALDESLCKK